MNSRTKSIFFILLFSFALYSTFTNVTNLSLSDFDEWITSKLRKEPLEGEALLDKTSSIDEKSLKVKNAPHTYVSSAVIEAVELLEQSIDFSQYPSREVTATGYTAGVESTGKTPSHPGYGITYSGVNVKRDLYSTIAADLEMFPLGTVLFIPGYGYGVVADKGGAIKGNKLDLYFPTVDDVYDQWGKQTLQVYVVKEGDGQLTEEDLNHLNDDESLQVFRAQMKR